MTETETRQLISNIIEQAKNNEQIRFTYIISWREFIHYIKLSSSTRLLIRALQTSANKLLKEYCKDVEAGTADVNKLLAHSQLAEMIAFYSTGLKILKRMIDDYDDYLGNGHFWYSIFGGERDIWNTP